MRNRLVYRPVIRWGLSALLIGIYALQAIFKFEQAANILSILTLGWIFVILAPILRIQTTFHVSALYFAAGITAFAVLDSFWSVMEITQWVDLTGNTILIALYLLTNGCFLVAIIQYARRSANRWSAVQFLLNLVTVSLILIGIVIYLFFDRQFTVDGQQVVGFIYLVIDTLSVAILLAMLISSNPRKNDGGHLLIFLALVQFYAADFLFVIQVLNNQYVPNGLADWLYLASLLLMANSMYTSYRHFTIRGPEYASPQEAKTRSITMVIVILTLPVLVLLTRGIRATEMLYFAAILIIYLLASLSNQSQIALENLLKERTEHNESLQQHVQERTAQLQERNEELNHALRYDALTGLYSRNYFLSLVSRAILQANPDAPVYLAIIDLARFRVINDLYTQEIGDQVLQEVAHRIGQFHDDRSTITTRLGSDEFAILCSCSPDREQIRHKLNHLLELFATPLEIGPFRIMIGVHIGIATYPENATNRTDFLKCAKTAVEQAKKKKINSYSFYNQKTYAAVRRHSDIDMALRSAVIAQEFSLHYQPQYSADGQTLLGMEALLRWNSPELGPVSPGEFIPIAEETGVVLELDRFAMIEAMRQIAEWNRQTGRDLKMGINVSPVQLENSDFLEFVKENLLLTGVKPSWLVFEVTEGIALLSLVNTSQILRSLELLGITVAMDDFGSGYSSYAYLKQFKVEYLKIDKILIDGISTDPRDAQIVQGIIAMARALRIKTLAEGVEQIDQAKLLVELGCDAIQGYLYGRPMPSEDFAKLLN